MKIRMLTSMAGDIEAFNYGDIVDTAQIVAQRRAAGMESIDGDVLGRGWVDAGLAEIPKSDAVLQADLTAATVAAEQAELAAEAAVAEKTEIAVERDTLRAQVDAMADAAGDGADALKRVGELTADNQTLRQQLAEREAQLGNAYAKAREDFDAEVGGLATSLTTARQALTASHG